ncbi:MAG: SIR2 family protein [Candidatus Omnitrophota bacterium]
MKFLQDTFKAELSDDSNTRVEEGVVYIRSRYWTAVDILELARTADGRNEVFDELFDEWLQERIENKSAEADEILDNLDQHDRFLRLTEAYKADGIMPFVGAGLSIPSGYPGWTHFLRKKWSETLLPKSDLDELLINGHYEDAAQKLADSLEDALFSEVIDHTFGCSREPLAGAAGLLPYIFNGSVVTTNFDNVIERCYLSADKPFSEKLSGHDSSEIKRLLALNERFILKLHGKAITGNGRILTKSEYDIHYEGDYTIQNTIKAICASNSLLFLGCSLTVDRTIAVIKEYVNEQGHDNLPKHYAFLEEPAEASDRIKRNHDLAACHIYPIWYPQHLHDESIEALLMKLYSSTR